MIKKPKLDRFYLNLKTGQYARLTGDKIAVDQAEKEFRKRSKINQHEPFAIRVSKREYRKHIAYHPLEYAMSSRHHFFGPRTCYKKKVRNGVTNRQAFHVLSYSINGHIPTTQS